MEGHEDIQNQLKNLTSKTAHIEQMLGRGSKTVVLQFGSHTLKYGIANDSAPQSVRCLVARKIRGLVEAPHATNSQVDSKRLAEVGKHIENFLTKKGNIKRGDPLNKGPKPKPMKLEPIREKFEFSEKPSDFGSDVYVGEEVYFVEGRKDYRIREPLIAGCLNTSLEYTFRDAISDLELVVRHALGMMNVPMNEIDQYSVVLCAPDKFHRAQYKLILDMLMGNIGFGGFCIHVESALASFGSGLSLACVVDIGATSITVTTVDEGIIVPNSQVKKTYGVRDVDILLWNMVSEKGGVSLIPDNGCTLSMQKYKHLAAIEKIREKYGILEIIEDQMKIADIILPSELNEPTKVAVPICPSFIVAPALFFHFDGLDTLSKPGLPGSTGARPIPDRAAELADGNLIEEEENPDDFEAKLNRQLNQITPEEQVRLNGVLEQVGLSLPRLQSETMPCNLEEIICFSICQLKDIEARKKAANAIVVTGGFSRTKFLVEELEDRLIERISRYDPNIERVEVIDYSKKEFDNADMVWIGGSILPKVDCMRDGFVSRNRWLGKIDHEEEKDRRWRKDCPEFGLKYLKEKLAFQW